MTEQPAEAAASPDPTSMLTSKAFAVLLLLAAVVGVAVSLVLAALLTGNAGAGAGRLIIIGVLVAYLMTQLLSKLGSSEIVTPPPPEAPARR